MARLVYVPNRIIDHNGIADGATVHVYLTETTTPIALFSDSGLTVPMANPFTVAAGAAFPDVFYDSAVTIKLTIVSATDGSIDEFDPYDPISAPTVTDTVVSVKDYGAVGDNVTDDSAAFVAAIAYLKSIAGNPANGILYKASPKLFVPAGGYYLGTTTIDITHTIVIEGEGGVGFGAGGGAASMLRWAANTTGIRIQAHNTSGATTVDGVNHSSGAFSTLRSLMLCGPASVSGLLGTYSLLEGEYHGVHIKSTVFLENVMVTGFQGDGFYAHNNIGGGSPTEGSSNNSRAYNCVAANNRNGWSILGGDANVWTFVGCQAMYNRACGVSDTCFLGNTHIGWHTSGNGIAADNDGSANFPAHVVSYSGNRYASVAGQEVGASTNAPSGTTADNTWWYYLSAGGSTAGIPAWSSGIHVRNGAPIYSGQGIWIWPYAEGGQGCAQFLSPASLYGGTFGTGTSPHGTGSWQFNLQGVLASYKKTGVIDPVTGINGTYINNGTAANSSQYIEHNDGTTDVTLNNFSGDYCLTQGNANNPSLFYYKLLGNSTANASGKWHIDFPNGISVNGVVWDSGTAPPGGAQANGANWPKGSYRKNSNPSVGQPKGWYCTVAGAPGTWVSEGNL